MDIVSVTVLVKEEIRSTLLIVSGSKLDDDNDDLKSLMATDTWKKDTGFNMHDYMILT